MIEYTLSNFSIELHYLAPGKVFYHDNCFWRVIDTDSLSSAHPRDRLIYCRRVPFDPVVDMACKGFFGRIVVIPAEVNYYA